MMKNEHIAFTSAVKDVQTRKGSRGQYARLLEASPQQTTITNELAGFIAGIRSAYLGTASGDGRPYVQHRGGPPGFLSVVDQQTIAFADFKGNRQYISQGNLAENPRAFLFLMDYRHQARVKLWGTAQVREDQPAVLADAMAALGDYRARAEQMLYFHVEAWEANCRQHIPLRYEEAEVSRLLESRDARIRELEQRLRQLGHGG